MIGSVSVVCMIDTGPHCRVGDVPEVPGYRKIDSVGDRDGDMSGIFSSHARHHPEIEKRPGEFLGFRGCVEKG